MPYTHFHDWSFHTHHRRPKGGNHYRAIRRHQRPWRIGAVIALVLTAVAGSVWFGAWLNTQGFISSEQTDVELPPALLTPVATAMQLPEIASPRIVPTVLLPRTAAVPVTLIQNASPPSTRTPTTATPTAKPTSAPTATPVATHTPEPTPTPIPTRTPRPTTPTPTQIPGRADLYNSFPLPQGLAYVWWFWEDSVHGLQSIEFDLTIHNDIDTRELPTDSGLYLILFMSDVAGTGYYFGIQTDVYDPRVGRGRGKGLIFSRWDTRDLSNVRVAPDGWSQSAGYEGDFVGVRKAYRWGAGDYRVSIALDEDDDKGRWFGLWITDKTAGETTWCGSLRFDRFASLEPSGGTAPEIYGFGSVKPVDIPEWHISMQRPVGDESALPTEAYIEYSSLVPNSNVTYDAKDSTVYIQVGGATERTKMEGWVNLGR